MRTFRLILAAAAAASAFGATPASAHHCIQVDDRMHPLCVPPHYCVMYPDLTIRCWN